MEVTLPSGLRGIVRAMKGREAQAFVDPQQIRTFGSMDTMLRNCWTETLDPGPYTSMMVEGKGARAGIEPRILAAAAQPPWSDRALNGDRFAALIDIRIATFGPDYYFGVKCVQCEAQYEWELDLSQLPRTDYPAASLEKFAAGDNNFRFVLPDDRLMAYKMSTAVEERKIAQLKGGPGSTKKLGPVDSIFTQTIGIYAPDGDPLVAKSAGMGREIEGDDGRKMREIPGGPVGIRRYLEELDYTVLLDIITGMQDAEGGVETKIETICDRCAWQQEIELPFQRSFFDHRAKKKPTTDTDH